MLLQMLQLNQLIHVVLYTVCKVERIVLTVLNEYYYYYYVPKIAKVRGQSVGNFPLNYTDEKREARLRRRSGTGTASTSNQIHQIAVL